MANISKPTGLSNIWASGGTKVDPGSSKVNIGWVVQLPPYEYQNWVDNRQDQAIAHISQHGVPEWDGITEYQGLLSYTQGSDGIIYKCIQTNTNKDPSNALNNAYWAVAFETFGSVAVVTAALNAHILNYQTLAGIGNPAGARTNLSLYSKAESDTRFASLNGSSAQVFSVGVASQPEHAVRLGQVSSLLTQATESATGVVRLATTGMTEAGADDLTAVTPLKAASVYLKKSGNLLGITNPATARANLGLGTMAVQNVGTFLQAANNLGDLNSAAIARANLGITSTGILPETYFNRVSLNLSDVPNIALARSNLGLTSTAVTPIGAFLLAGNNLADLPSPAAARNALGLSAMATSDPTQFMYRANNLADLTNVQAARNALGLSAIVTKNVSGLSNPAGDINFVNAMSGNTGGTILPNGLIINWGVVQAGGAATFTIPFTSGYTVTCQHGPSALGSPGSGVTTKTNTYFVLGYGVGGYMYQAIGN